MKPRDLLPIVKLSTHVLFVLSCAIWTAAQSSLDKGTPAESKPGTSTPSTYAPDKLETVNLANGNLSMNLPLVSIGGRGSASFTLALSYNSKIWSTQHDKEDTGVDPAGSPLPYVHHYYAWYDQASMESPNRFALGAGWSISLGPALKMRKVNIGPHKCSDNRNTCYTWVLTKLSLVMPDGAEVELRDQFTQGAPHWVGSAPAFSQADRSRGRVWLSGDGSATTYVSDADNGVVNNQLNGWVFLADGTRIRMEGDSWGQSAHFTRIIDRNGNFVVVNYANPAGITYTDELGRQVILNWTPPAPLTITVKGYSGVPDRVISINVETIGALDGSGIAGNLRSDFRSLPRPFTSGDYMRTAQGNWDHTIVGPHTDVFLGSESGDNVDEHYAVTRVNLLDGRSLRFRYNQYGEVAEVIYPGGGVSQIDYQGSQTSMCEGIAPYTGAFDRRVTQRRLLTDGTNLDATWTYAIDTIGKVGTVQVHQGDQNGPLLSSEMHYFLALKADYKVCRFVQQTADVMADGTHYERWDNAKEYRVEKQTGAGTEVTMRQWEQRTLVVYLPEPNATYTQEQPANDPRVIWEETTLDNGRKKRTEYTYDDFNNVTLIKEYDFGGTDGSTGPLVRQTLRNYATNLNGYCYSNLNPLDSSCGTTVTTNLSSIIYQRHNLVSETIKDAAGNQKASAEYEYDNYVSDQNHGPVTLNSGMLQYDATQFTPFAVSNQPRGNVTRVKRWAGASDYIYSFSKYDEAGNTIWSKDPKGNVTTASFADNFGNGSNPDAGSSGTNGLTYAFSTLVTNSLGHQMKAQFDYTRGVQTGVKDANGVVSKTEYDLIGRPTRQTAALGLAEQAVSEISYPTASSNFSTTSKQLDATRWLAAKTVHDGFSRDVTAFTAEDGQHANSASFTIRVDTEYDGLGRVKRISNPYRPGALETAAYTVSSYDVAGRITTVTTPDGAVVGTTYAGNSVTVSDQTNKQRKSVTDALGRLKEVYEAPNDPAFNYLTSYEYDVLDNLVKVTQGSQQRFFMYDPLKRLIRADNPEPETLSALNLFDPVTNHSNWSVKYEYDANSNLTSKTDPRGVVTQNSYDALNRLTAVLYRINGQPDPNTGDIEYLYDNATNGKGRLWLTYRWGAKPSHTAVGQYDALGRMKQVYNLFGDGQGGWSAGYGVSRTYNLAGEVASQTYPSGHAVTYEYDGTGRTSSLTGNVGDGVTRTYASSFLYNARSQVTQELYGTQTQLYHKLQYNIRGQLWDVRISTNPDVNGSMNRGGLQYFYDSSLGYGTSGPDNNGNVLFANTYSPEDEQDTKWAIHRQSYAYDSLNRLKSVTEYFVNYSHPQSQQYVQTYDYDRWGNRTINTGQTWGTGINNKAFETETARNRLYSPGDLALAEAQRRIAYDKAGNQIKDTYTGYGTATFDGDNRIAAIQDKFAGSSTYTYNANAQRVRRRINNQETWQIYGIDGELVAEYAANAAVGTPQKEYGYRDGQLLITAEPASSSNVALAANGATATGSTTLSPYVAANVIDGSRRAINGTAWLDNTFNSFPDWIEISFNGSKTISEIDVITQQDDSQNPVEPTLSQIFSLYGITAFDVQYWNGSAWATVPGGSVTGNNKVWRQFSFAPITTSKIRVMVNAGVDNVYSRVVEVEAWTGASSGSAQIQWLVPDHLGTPRIILDQTGSFANVKRHDYLPFGEELPANTGGRTTVMGYAAGDGVRQQFTQKERDIETGLDYYGARYANAVQGRFISVDPAILSQKQLSNPQDVNRYSFVANNPLAFIDQDGREKIRVIVRTFIPEKTVQAPSPGVVSPTLPLPGGRTFAGDGRKVGEPGTYRTQQIITIETDRMKNGGCSACPLISSDATAGKTRELFAGGATKEGRADVSHVTGAAIYTMAGSDHITVTATGRAADPLVVGAPDLKYNLNIGLGYDKDGKLYASLDGTHSEYPGVEVFVQRLEGNDQSEQLVKGYNPQDLNRGLFSIYLTDKIEGSTKLKP
jgi:RHS repeat-associated protein